SSSVGCASRSLRCGIRRSSARGSHPWERRTCSRRQISRASQTGSSCPGRLGAWAPPFGLFSNQFEAGGCKSPIFVSMSLILVSMVFRLCGSAANVGADKDSDKRQRAAIQGFAKRAGFEVVTEYYDPGVSGSDPIEGRKGFAELLDRVENNGVATVIVED